MTAVARCRRVGPPAAAVITAAAGCAFLWFADPTTPGGLVPVCPTKAVLGIDCPGCGSARMVYSLMHGDVASSLRYNALGVVALVVVGLSFVSWLIYRHTGVWRLRWDRRRWAPLVTLAVVLGWFVVRNLPFAPFTGLRV